MAMLFASHRQEVIVLTYQYWEIETPEGTLLIEMGWPKSEISMNGRRVSKRINSPALWVPIVHEFDSNGNNYQVKHTAGINYFKNLGANILVRRNGETIVENPKRTGFFLRGFVLLVLFAGALGILIATALIMLAIYFGFLPAPD